MNHPLRYRVRHFIRLDFEKDDSATILEVVQNPEPFIAALCGVRHSSPSDRSSSSAIIWWDFHAEKNCARMKYVSFQAIVFRFLALLLWIAASFQPRQTPRVKMF